MCAGKVQLELPSLERTIFVFFSWDAAPFYAKGGPT